MRKLSAIPLLLLAICILCAACGASTLRETPSTAYESVPMAEEAAMPPGGTDESDIGYEGAGRASGTLSLSQQASQVEIPRMILRTAELNQNTKAFDEDLQAIRSAVQQLGGHVVSSDISGSREGQSRTARITARVPAEQYDSALDALRVIGENTKETTNEQDRTEEYIDNDIRIQVLEQNLARLEEWQSSAASIEDILYLQEEMNSILLELDSLKAGQRYIVRRAEEATIQIVLSERASVEWTPVDDSVGTRMREGFTNTLNGMVRVFEHLAVFAVSAAPVLIVLAILAGIVLGIVWLSQRKSRKKTKTPEKPAE